MLQYVHHTIPHIHRNTTLTVILSLSRFSLSPHLFWFEDVLWLQRISKERVCLTTRNQVELGRLVLVNERLLLTTLDHVSRVFCLSRGYIFVCVAVCVCQCVYTYHGVHREVGDIPMAMER